MEYDERAAAAKGDEILRAAERVRVKHKNLSDSAIATAVRAFSQVTPPEEAKFTIGLITISSLYSAPKADSRKPGNIILNWRKLIDIVPDVSLAGLGAATLPIAPTWSAVLAGLYVWNKVWRGSVEDFNDSEAIAVLALWKSRNAENEILEDTGFEKTNEVRANYSLPALTRGQFAAIVDRLIRIKCIEIKDGTIWLREWVRIKYP